MDIEKLKKATELKRHIVILKVDIDLWDRYQYKCNLGHTDNIDDNIYASFRTSVINDLKLKSIEAEKEFAGL